MAEIITMPRLSDTMTEGVVAKWFKQVGDKVEEGDILAEIETDKATMEFESFHSGVLLHQAIAEGQTSPVDTILAIVGEKGEDISALLNAPNEPSEPKQEEPQPAETKAVASASPELLEKIITMPRLSDTMTEGVVATWLKQIGDQVEEGDILAEIETDKATMEFEAFKSGKLIYQGVAQGESAPVDSVLCILGSDDDDVPTILAAAQKGETPPAPAVEEKPKSVETQEPVSVSPEGDNQRIFASPLAKKMAADNRLDLSKIKGTGENGRIVKVDIEKALQEKTSTPEVQTTKTSPSFAHLPNEVQEMPNSQMRKAITKALSNSKFTAPHFYLTIEVDMENAIASRKTINALPETKVSFNDMVVKAVAVALRKHPQVNSTWTEETTKVYPYIHIGVAVAVAEGLVVPVLNHTDHLSLTDIGTQVKTLAKKARDKKLQPNEMQGSTFTISNLGMFGIESFTSIINQPNSAILSVGAIVEKPVVKNGQLVVGNTMKLTLACDHRTVDGAVGAQFLQTLKTYIENPVTMLV